MRFILIDAGNRKIFDCASPFQIDEPYIAGLLRCDLVHRIDLTDESDLWVSGEPKLSTFRFFGQGPVYAGDGIMVGRSKMNDIKSLPRWFEFDAMVNWISWPSRTGNEAAKPITLKPLDFPRRPRIEVEPGIVSMRRDAPYVMPMYR